MLSVLRTRGIAAIAVLLTSAVALAGCDDDSTAPDPEPAVATMRLTVGAQSVTINSQGVCTGCPLVLTDGAQVTAEWLNANGTPDAVAVEGTGLAARYRLQVTVPTNTIGLTFTFNNTQSFRGTFDATGVTATPLELVFRLRDITESEDEFGPHNVPVTVVTP